jgi:hypothetical protein
LEFALHRILGRITGKKPAYGAHGLSPGWLRTAQLHFLRMSSLFNALIGGVGMVAPTAFSRLPSGQQN